MELRYPRLEINLSALRGNANRIVDLCGEQGVSVVGVIKGATGIPQVAKAFADGGVDIIGSSRLEQLRDARDFGIEKPLMLIRVPMMSEIEEVVELCAGSLNSEISVLEALNEEATKQHKVHRVVLMADLGDLREGFWDKEELIKVALNVENEMENLYLEGVGTNVGCYGSILPTPEKLQELVDIAREIEYQIGRKLDIVSGGATSSLMRVVDKNIPEGINALRIGEGILLNRDLGLFYGYDIEGMRKDVFTLKAEVIEVKVKPSHPQGEIGVDAFGKRPEYVDRGMRKRALIAIGKVDYGDPDEIFPRDEEIEVLGASSDHTILDIEDYSGDLKPGDVLEFDINYASIVYLTNCRNVKTGFVEDSKGTEKMGNCNKNILED